jgi:hypothetical protein
MPGKFAKLRPKPQGGPVGKFLTSVFTLSLLILTVFAVGTVRAADPLLVVDALNISATDTLIPWEAVGSCTTVVTVVTKVDLSGTDTLTVADSLFNLALPSAARTLYDNTEYSAFSQRPKWNVRIKTFQKNSSPDTDSTRTLTVKYKDRYNATRTFTLNWTAEVDTQLPYSPSKILQVISVEYEDGDSIGIYAHSDVGVGIATSPGLYYSTAAPYYGQVQGDTIFPRCVGKVAIPPSMTYCITDAACKPGYFALVSGTATKLTPTMSIIDSLWVVGTIQEYKKAAAAKVKILTSRFPMEP